MNIHELGNIVENKKVNLYSKSFSSQLDKKK